MSYCTVINCMDGRVQRPALDWRDRTIRCRRVDSITESGVNGLWIRPLGSEAFANRLEQLTGRTLDKGSASRSFRDNWCILGIRNSELRTPAAAPEPFGRCGGAYSGLGPNSTSACWSSAT